MSTDPSLSVDARGMACPRPIIELAKLRRRAPAGSRIEIIADDLAFESDLRAWCETTGNHLKTINRDGDIVNATIELAP
jgi:tRNA 2-thiouridine synthesizing protein A